MASGITLCGSLSKHAVSLGAAMHEAGYRALGLNYRYVPFEVSDVKGALDGMRALNIRGFGVSMPFKLDVLPHLDALDPLAARIGAVNTIVNDAGHLTGHNTDAWGACRALEEALPLSGASVLVLGAGGAARAVVHGLLAEGARVTLSNRTFEKARKLAEAAETSTGQRVFLRMLEVELDLFEFDALVNCTPATMAEYGGQSPVPAEKLVSNLAVMDIVYKPIETVLLDDARRAGARVVHGGRMLLHQAARQFELYTGRVAPLGVMDAALGDVLAGGGP